MGLAVNYNRAVYRNEKTGYSRFYAATSEFPEYHNEHGYITCEGVIPALPKGTPIFVSGTIKTIDNEHTFACNKVEYISNRNTAMIFLSKGLVKGVGEKTAEKILSFTGDDIYAAFHHTDNSIDLISDDQYTELRNKIMLPVWSNGIFLYLNRFDGDYSVADKIVKKYGERGLYLLKRKPFTVGEASGLRFDICDAIYCDNGGEPYSKFRIEALAVRALEFFSNAGHTYVSFDQLANKCNSLTRRFSNEPIPEVLLKRACFNSERIIIEKVKKDFRIYLKTLYTAEQITANQVKRILSSKKKLNYNDSVIEQAEEELSVKFSGKQRDAFSFLADSGIKLLTGKPGTGKTTVIKGLISAYKKHHPRSSILLAAPTGRAAQRLSEGTGQQAFTIHKALDVKPFGEGFICKDSTDPLCFSLIIIDEVSMMDISMTAMLLSAVRNNTLVIFCGDIEQLPSVGAGNVFHDLIESKLFPVIRLDVNHRQREDSLIIDNALSVISGKKELKTDASFVIEEYDDVTEIKDRVLQIAKTKWHCDDIYACQMLSSTKKDKAGSVSLNAGFQSDVITDKSVKSIKVGDTKFFVGDKVMTTANKYADGYVNGDVGEIVDITPIGVSIKTPYNTVIVPKANLVDLTTAYALTTHKSQGSEYDTVIISLPAVPSQLLQRNLLYTAITRAKKEVYIIAQTGALTKAIETKNTSLRQTGLQNKLSEQHFEIR